MRTLNIPLYAAVGLLEGVWNLTAREAPQGNIGKLTDDDIADSLGWTDNPSVLIDALVHSGWIDGDADYRLVVHDWHDHADDAVRKSLQRSNLQFLSRHVATIPDTVETKPDKNRLPEPSLAGAKPEPKATPKAAPASFAVPLWISAVTWHDFEEMRKRIRAPLTDRARRDTVAELERLRTQGHDPEQVLAQSIQRGWRGVFKLSADTGGANGKPSRNEQALTEFYAELDAANRASAQ